MRVLGSAAIIGLASAMGCAAVPSVSFSDDAGDASAVDAALIDGAALDGAALDGATADASVDTSMDGGDAAPICPSNSPPNNVTCCSNNIACVGNQCNTGTCAKCAQHGCTGSVVCCSLGGGSVSCIKLGDPCP